MPGIATHLRVLDLTLERLVASGDPALTDVADVINANPAFAALGAIGPAIADFMPAGRAEDVNDDPNPYAFVWKNIFAILGGDESRFPGSGLGLHKVLVDLRRILDELTHVAAHEDCDRLEAIRDGEVPGVSLETIESTAADFAAIVAALDPATSSVIGTIASTITDRLRPAVSTSSPLLPVPPPEQWSAREFLHWSRTGPFVDALLTVAGESGDERLRAYAYGYVIGYATNVCGSPFVNSCVGGPHRTQWWRRRFVNNFVDTWVYGRYELGPPPAPADSPSPPYPDWPNIAVANLQQRIELAPMDAAALLVDVKQNRDLPAGVVPDDFADRWMHAVELAYPGPRPVGISAASLNQAAQMTWLQLWFQTSGEVIGLAIDAPIEPPGGCADQGALDPFVPAEGGGPSLPPTFDSDLKDDTAVVCGIILAILGGLLILAGAAAAGGAAIAGAIALLDCSNVVEWHKLRCQLFWYKTYLHNGLKGMNELLALTGLAYPYTEMLAADEIVSELLPLPFESGQNLVKSLGDKQRYPSKPWDGELLTFNQRPTDTNPGVEKPPTTAYRSAVYPSFFVDDDVNNPLTNGDVKTGGGFPDRSVDGSPVQFGNAVANAVDLLGHLAIEHPSWNLDADRGLAAVVWRFAAGYDPDAVSIVPEP